MTRLRSWIGRVFAILLLALATVAALVSSASADPCKNVDIKLDNQTSVRIKALMRTSSVKGKTRKKSCSKCRRSRKHQAAGCNPAGSPEL
jgi:hypothetical protein